jgi:hypothetical protein
MAVLLINISADNSADIIMGMYRACGRVSVSAVHMDVQYGTTYCDVKTVFGADEHRLK